MKTPGKVGGWIRLAVIAVPGAGILATSCAADVRQSIVAAGLDFVEGTAGEILAAIFPVDEALAGD